ncbi:MAG: hypothetical protein QM778_07865 [Myxococcales bacterium]
MSFRDRWLRRVFVGSLLLSGVAQSGCGDDGGDAEGDTDSDAGQPPADPFVSAAALDATWCVTAQRTVTGFDEMGLPDASVKQVTSANVNDFVSSRADVANGVLQVQAFVELYPNPVAPASASLSRGIACKLRTQEAVKALLGAQPSGTPQSCRLANEKAWTWAREQLTPDELAHYEQMGHKLSFADDVANAVGPMWAASNATLTKNGDSYVLASSALVSPGTGDFSDGTQGAVYCKLWTPAQMLYWLRVRAFDADPLASEPKAPDPGQMDCTPAATHTGSCTFLFTVAATHFCEDYTGANWTAETSAAKCTARGGTYSAEPCVNRKAETDTFDGDGMFKGQCVLKCGTGDEYVWNTYSGSGDGSGCATGKWIPAGG